MATKVSMTGLERYSDDNYGFLSGVSFLYDDLIGGPFFSTKFELRFPVNEVLVTNDGV